MNAVLRRKPGVLRVAITGGLLVLMCAGAGYEVSTRVPDGTLISLIKYATVILAVVWGFSMAVYNKLSDLTEIDGIDYRQHRGLEVAIQLRLQWFWYRATLLGFVGLSANLPMFMKDGGITPPPWAFSVAFGSLALALYLLRRVWAELEEIRALRSEVKELERMEEKRAEQVRSLKNGTEEWSPDARLSGIGTGTDAADK